MIYPIHTGKTITEDLGWDLKKEEKKRERKETEGRSREFGLYPFDYNQLYSWIKKIDNSTLLKKENFIKYCVPIYYLRKLCHGYISLQTLNLMSKWEQFWCEPIIHLEITPVFQLVNKKISVYNIKYKINQQNSTSFVNHGSEKN